MKKVNVLLICLLATTLTFATTYTAPVTSCPAPQNVTKVAQSSGSISFDWDDCGCANQSFLVHFVVNGSTSSTYQVSSSEITFSNLAPGVYQFHFQTDCGSGSSSEIIITEDAIIG